MHNFNLFLKVCVAADSFYISYLTNNKDSYNKNIFFHSVFNTLMAQTNMQKCQIY